MARVCRSVAGPGGRHAGATRVRSRVVDDLRTESLETTPIPDLGAIVVERLGPVGDGLDSVGSVDGGVTALVGYATGPEPAGRAGGLNSPAGVGRTMSTVRLDQDGGVATITIDRQDRYNALDSATLAALESALADARTDEVAAPTEKASSPSPVRTTHRVSLARPAIPSASSSSTWGFTAFIASGRETVTVPTSPSRSTVIVS